MGAPKVHKIVFFRVRTPPGAPEGSRDRFRLDFGSILAQFLSFFRSILVRFCAPFRLFLDAFCRQRLRASVHFLIDLLARLAWCGDIARRFSC